MKNQEDIFFDDVDSVIQEPIKFKIKLNIGEDAYTSLRLKNLAFETWDTAGAALTAASIAKSSAVASAFFAPKGILAVIGIGTAVTPVGWIIAAGFVAGGTWLGISRFTKKSSTDRVTVIPNFINTPIDVLGLGLFNLIAPLAMKIAHIDDDFDKKEKDLISNYFINEWGYDPKFIDEGLVLIESKIREFSIKELAQTLAEFKNKNPDCNYKSMSQEIIKFLKEITEADGRVDEREEMAIERVEAIFKAAGKVSIKKTAKSGIFAITKKTKEIVSSSVIATKRLATKEEA